MAQLRYAVIVTDNNGNNFPLFMYGETSDDVVRKVKNAVVGSFMLDAYDENDDHILISTSLFSLGTVWVSKDSVDGCEKTS